MLLMLIALLVTSWVVGGILVSPANRAVPDAPQSIPAESLTLTSKSGNPLSAWLVQAEDSKGMVILLHQFRGNRASMLGRSGLLLDAGYSSLLVDLQAHGESPGTNITLGYRERLDVQAVVEYVRQEFPEQKVGVIGRSLGGASALMALPLNIDALVLEAVFPTLEQAVRNRVKDRIGPLHHLATPALLLQMKPRLGISPNQIKPIDKMSQLPCPVLVLVGDQDHHTTVAECKAMLDHTNQPKKLVIFPGARHQNLLNFDTERYQIEVINFIEQQLCVQ